MIRVLAVMLVAATLFASPGFARGVGRGGPPGFAPHSGFVHPGFAGHPGFFPRRNFANNRFFFRGFAGPGVIVAPYPGYPYPYYPYPYYPYPYYPYPPYP
jgi:hypothetical protein